MTELGKSLFEEGKLENAIETAKRSIKEDMSDQFISKLVGLYIREIQIIRIATKTNKTN
ncbi:hypothetical protein [Clostridium sp. BL-8]|uniref:hypothetical protein n=1 Tax=Clostridium sp. BL-8 TaxID=349938 RepID=UPI0009CDB330|nr:hypothetical protein [Clostridium sp. BL-8]OOM74982.1 hypothetical protein CLOBL_41320 [Clostridium sp. BL-8]